MENLDKDLTAGLDAQAQRSETVEYRRTNTDEPIEELRSSVKDLSQDFPAKLNAKVLMEEIKKVANRFDEESHTLDEYVDRINASFDGLSQRVEALNSRVKANELATQKSLNEMRNLIASSKPKAGLVGGRPGKQMLLANLISYWRAMPVSKDSSSSYRSSWSSDAPEHDNIELKWPLDLTKSEHQQCYRLTWNLKGNDRFFLSTVLDQCNPSGHAQSHFSEICRKSKDLQELFERLIFILQLPPVQ